MSEPDSILMQPVSGPIRGTIRPPGSKSITNRALIVAALADGESRLTGVLDSRDTQVMIESLGRLGIGVEHDKSRATAIVRGGSGRIPSSNADLYLENSGTSIRFLTALCALGHGRYRLDGNARMRERPIADLVDALNGLGSNVACENPTGCPPVVVSAAGMKGGATRVAGTASSQFLSALLMPAPCALGSIEITIEGELVSKPYADMTVRVMESFGAKVEQPSKDRYRITPQRYRATQYDVEPDASAASYFFAAAAITGGEVTVNGLTRGALQGDLRFVEALEQMGCRVAYGPISTTVTGGPLHGIDVDMGDISDTAQTLAAVAVFADGPTRIRNIAHVRHKETDRIAAVATELRRMGLRADEVPDGLTIHPGPPAPTTVYTYDDHRMAMSFALVGLRAEGIRIADPGCTAKTYPHFFDDLSALRGGK